VQVKKQRAGRLLGIAVIGAGIVLASAGGAAAAASPPTAITGPVTAVGPTTATANGTVNPNGQATTWHVEYGTTTSYGSRSADRSAGSGTTNVAVSATLANLAPGTTYHYRVVATSGAGTSRGADGIFATSTPPGVSTGTASNVTVASATLSGTVDPNGRPTTWYFEYGTSTGYGSRTADQSAGAGANAVGVSASVAGLTRGRVYHFRLVATSDAGTSRGGDRTFTTSGAPRAVTGNATSIGPTSSTLTGNLTANGLATTWYFEFGTTTRYGSRTPVRSAGSGTSSAGVSASLTGLRAATTYHYRLVAANAAGTSLGTDRAFSTTGPPAVRTEPAGSVSWTTATATGSVDPRGRGTTWYFEYGTTTGYGSRTPARSAGSGFGARSVTASITGLRPATTYHYRLVAASDAGTSRGADLAFTTAGVTLIAPALRVVYGRAVMLRGTVPTRRPGEVVVVLAQSFGEGSFRSVASVLTGADGAWSYLARPTIRTSYAASWQSGTSPAKVVGVRPAVSLRRNTSGSLVVRVSPARSFAARFVKLQRRAASGRWITVTRVRLNGRSSKIFRASLPRGTSRLRVAMSVNQAGAGYLGGFSRIIVVRRG
jgi:hypothetical protein